jgi:regulatory protein
MPDAEQFARCYATALRILQHRWNAAAELRRKLKRKEFDDETIAVTIARLDSEKWLDDSRFADAFVRGRLRKRMGPMRIRRELGAAGVDNDVIDNALAPYRDADGERATLVDLARKKAASLIRRGEEDDRLRQKLSAYLARQGFETSLVIDVVREVLAAN